MKANMKAKRAETRKAMKAKTVTPGLLTQNQKPWRKEGDMKFMKLCMEEVAAQENADVAQAEPQPLLAFIQFLERRKTGKAKLGKVPYCVRQALQTAKAKVVVDPRGCGVERCCQP